MAIFTTIICVSMLFVLVLGGLIRAGKPDWYRCPSCQRYHHLLGAIQDERPTNTRLPVEYDFCIDCELARQSSRTRDLHNEQASNRLHLSKAGATFSPINN